MVWTVWPKPWQPSDMLQLYDMALSKAVTFRSPSTQHSSYIVQENKAVWLQGPGIPSIVGPAPVPEPSEKELLIQVKAIAVQPGEWKIQAGIIPIPLTYPAIIGVSLSGVVVKTGPEVDRFQPGDRVACNSTGTLRNDPRYGAYQRYCLAPQALTSKIYGTGFDEAASLATAYGAFSAWFIHLGLDPSGLWSREAAKKCHESVLVWGVSSSFGFAAAQIAGRAGYDVVGVASAHHESLASKVGVCHFADRKADGVVDTVAALGPFKAILAAADSAEDQVKMGEIAARLGGGNILSTMGLRSGVTLPPGVTISFQQFLDDYLDPKNKEFTESVWWGYLEDAFAQGWLHSLPLKPAGGLSQVAGAWKSLQSGEVSGTRLIIDPELD